MICNIKLVGFVVSIAYDHGGFRSWLLTDNSKWKLYVIGFSIENE